MFSQQHTQTSGGYEIQRSLRFNSADSAYLNRTPASAGNRKTWTWSGWVKRSALSGSRQGLFVSVSPSGTEYTGLEFNVNNELVSFDNNATGASVVSSQVFRDVSAWYHIVWAYDTTQATAANRVRLYVNGVEITAFVNASYPTQNSDSRINTTNPHIIGGWIPFDFDFDGYITEINFIDGQALTPSSFGEYNADTGVWQPKRYAGSYGTNGFYLNFSNNSNTTAATLGADYSGNGNNWTPNNFSVSAGAGNDSLVDSPTSYGTDTGVGGTVRGNYCTANPLDKGSDITLTNGNLEISTTFSWSMVRSTFAMTSGKWYWEAYPTTSSTSNFLYGIARAEANLNSGLGFDANGWSYFRDGQKYTNNAGASYGASWANGDVIGVAFDADAGTLTFFKNGASQGTAFSGLTSGPYFPSFSNNATAVSFANFGQRPFAYTAPSGFKALNTQNLPTPTIGATPATQANKYFDVVLRNGGAPSGGTYSTTVNMANGALLWDKPRNSASSNYLVDSVRGISKNLRSNTTDAESTDASWFTGFNNGSFNTGSSDWGSSTTVVDWILAANGAGVTNTAGSITSTVSANTTSGFSVVKWNGSGNATIGHGLGVAPSMYIVKLLDQTSQWYVYFKDLGAGKYMQLNLTAAASNDTAIWQNTAPTATVFSIGSGINANNMLAYCFAEVPGYSKFGSYTGNGSTDGPFVFCGFRPKYVMAKCTNTNGDWFIVDATRSPYNQTFNELVANSSGAEYTGTDFDSMDMLSNGFKLRVTNTSANANGNSYIFMAFAESPQKFSLAR